MKINTYCDLVEYYAKLLSTLGIEYWFISYAIIGLSGDIAYYSLKDKCDDIIDQLMLGEGDELRFTPIVDDDLHQYIAYEIMHIQVFDRT